SSGKVDPLYLSGMPLPSRYFTGKPPQPTAQIAARIAAESQSLQTPTTDSPLISNTRTSKRSKTARARWTSGTLDSGLIRAGVTLASACARSAATAELGIEFSAASGDVPQPGRATSCGVA